MIGWRGTVKKIYHVALATAFFLSCIALASATPFKEILYTKKVALAYPKTYTFRFSLYDAESDGLAVWSEDKAISLTGAKLTTKLGDAITFDEAGVDFSQQLWVQVDRWVKAKNAWVPVGTRDRLGVVPYAIWSERSDTTAAVDIGGGITGTLPVASGGTGATTAPGARANLGAAASGTNSDITSLLGLLNPLSIDQGGTGSATQNFVDLTTDQTIGGTKTFSGPIASTVAAGVAPLQVASTTMVSNLNAEMVGGKKLSDLDARYGPATQAAQPAANILTTVDPTGDEGYLSSITIGADGFPVISYYYHDGSSGDLKVARCSNAACTASTSANVDSAGDVGWYTSIAIGTDGYPVVSYYDVTNQDLKVAKCGNAVCTASTITAVDSAGDVGLLTSIAIGTDGYPVISYFDVTNADLKMAKCSNAACTASTITTVDSTGNRGRSTSIAIGTDGFPVISYYDVTNRDLRVAKCADAACISATLTTVDSTGVVGIDTSIAIGMDGYPVIAYYDNTNQDLKFAKCGDAACASAIMSTVDSTGNVGPFTSITIGTDGYPVISYLDGTNLDLKIAKCGDAACSSKTLTTVDSAGMVGYYTSITLGTDGYPVISYFDQTNLDLKVAKCANQYCLNNWRRR